MPKDTGVVPLSFGGRRCCVRGRASAGGEVVHDSLVGELGERVEANTRIEPPTALSRYATSGDIPARGGSFHSAISDSILLETAHPLATLLRKAPRVARRGT